jgi:hypothetical protein
VRVALAVEFRDLVDAPLVPTYAKFRRQEIFHDFDGLVIGHHAAAER